MYFEKNMLALKKTKVCTVTDFEEKLVNIKVDSDLVEIVPTQVLDLYTCKAALGSADHKIFLHSTINPLEEAEEQITALSKLNSNSFTIIIGFGFGYHVREIIKRKLDRGSVLVIEPRMDILKAAMTCMDLTDILSHDKITFIEYNERFKETLYEYIKIVNVFIGNPIIYQLTPYNNITSEGLDPIRKAFIEMVKYACMAAGDSSGDTLIGIINGFNGIQHLFNSFDFRSLKEQYNKVPAIIVSAGPSLDKNFKLLREVKGNALIIAAETIQEKLLRNGIVPDIVSVLERGMNVYESYFANKELNPEVVLFGQTVIEDLIFSTYPGKSVVCIKQGPIFETWLAGRLGGMNSFNPGQSVANMNFSIARILGCDPIIFIGQDLAFSDDRRTHAQGTVTEKQTAEEFLKKFDHEIIKVKGNYADFVETGEIYYQFLRWFELEIPKTEAQVINATEGGAYIKGTVLMTLREAIDRYCKDGKGILRFIDYVKDVEDTTKHERLNNVISGLNEEISKLMNLEEHINKGIDDCSSIIHGKNLQLEKIISIFEEIRLNKLQYPHHSTIFTSIVQAAIIVSIREDVSKVSLDSMKDIMEWVRKQKEFFEDMKKILKITLKIFKYGEKKLEAMRDGEKIIISDLQNLISEVGS